MTIRNMKTKTDKLHSSSSSLVDLGGFTNRRQPRVSFFNRECGGLVEADCVVIVTVVAVAAFDDYDDDVNVIAAARAIAVAAAPDFTMYAVLMLLFFSLPFGMALIPLL